MRSRFVRMVAFLSMIACFCSMLGACSCSGRLDRRTEKVFEYFKYLEYADKEGGKYVRIIGLTEEGEKQKVLVVPKEIDGMRIESLSDPDKYLWDGNGAGGWASEVLEKVFMHKKYNVASGMFACPKLHAVCIIRITEDDWAGGGMFNEIREGETYIRPNLFFRQEKPERWFSPANVAYYYNYENAENDGIYWIDKENYGSNIEYIPNIPTRGEYKFEGWYKETECINKWDFKNDKLPAEQKGSDGKVIFQETKLYARWTQKLKK